MPRSGLVFDLQGHLVLFCGDAEGVQHFSEGERHLKSPPKANLIIVGENLGNVAVERIDRDPSESQDSSPHELMVPRLSGSHEEAVSKPVEIHAIPVKLMGALEGRNDHRVAVPNHRRQLHKGNDDLVRRPHGDPVAYVLHGGPPGRIGDGVKRVHVPRLDATDESVQILTPGFTGQRLGLSGPRPAEAKRQREHEKEEERRSHGKSRETGNGLPKSKNTTSLMARNWFLVQSADSPGGGYDWSGVVFQRIPSLPSHVHRSDTNCSLKAIIGNEPA
jgi:hypothetical protein